MSQILRFAFFACALTLTVGCATAQAGKPAATASGGKAAPPTKLEPADATTVDAAFMHLNDLDQKQKQIEAARKHYEAQIAAVKKKYQISDRDKVDVVTGEITRAPAAPPTGGAAAAGSQ